MKTYRHLYHEVWDWDNLIGAFQAAVRGKKYTAAMARFEFRLEENLLLLQQALREKTYRPGRYKTFYIRDPKKRMISAAPFRDRVVHHALCRVIEPLFERSFIYDSYANRRGKGTQRAIIRYQQYAWKYPYVLKCDIRKFFPSLDHAILKEEIRWKIQCPDTLWLVDQIIDGSNPQEPHEIYFPGDDLFTPFHRRKGLPIGNLTSQFWANVYLNRFDHFIKEELQVPGYIRYVDDFVLFGEDKGKLWAWKRHLERYLAEKLRLIVHPRKTHIHQVNRGVPFLGFRVFPEYRQILKRNARRHRRFRNKKLKAFRAGKMDTNHLEASLNSWLGHIRFGQSQRLEYHTFWEIKKKGVSLFRHPCASWRLLEQQRQQQPRNESQQQQSEQQEQQQRFPSHPELALV